MSKQISLLSCVIAGRRKDTPLFYDTFPTPKDLQMLQKEISPQQFDLQHHLSAIREHNRQRRQTSTCHDRYLLFMLDTSGSIGKSTFTRMVNKLSLLAPLFCDNTKIAAMTFGSQIYHEFCFDCHNPIHLSSAIASIKYHGGSTKTGRAVKCACDKILTIPCGLPSRDDYQNCPAPIDVIVITDGYSNGPLDVCAQAKCLHQQSFYDVNTFTIGVGNYNQRELDCIVDKNDLNLSHIFNMESFDDLEEFITQVLQYLQTPIDKNKPASDPTNYRTCFDINDHGSGF